MVDGQFIQKHIGITCVPVTSFFVFVCVCVLPEDLHMRVLLGHAGFTVGLSSLSSGYKPLSCCR